MEALAERGRAPTSLVSADFEPVRRDDAELVHSKELVDRVWRAEASGFGVATPAIRDQVLWANGAMVAAVAHALTDPIGLACAPVSGFHHAGWNFSGGYCTLNGLMISIAAAVERGMLDRDAYVLIIDGDAHYGNGTDDIINVTTQRCHAGRQPPRGLVYNWTRGDITSPEDHLFSWSPTTWQTKLDAVLRLRPWDLILYQAGADAHASDPYGGGCLDDGDWKVRDAMVFYYATEHRIPLAFCLAGGYNGDATVNLHVRTIGRALQASAQNHASEYARRLLHRDDTPGPAPSLPAQST